MDYASPGRWKARVKIAAEKKAARDDHAEIRAERARIYAEQAARSTEQAALNDAAQRDLRIACPCCGEGRVTVEVAERIYRALERLPHDSKPDILVLATLAAVARGEAVHGPSPKISEGLSHPKAAPVIKVPQVQKANKINKLDRGETDDGALIEP